MPLGMTQYFQRRGEFPCQTGRLVLFSVMAMGTSSVKELCLREISPFLVTTYVLNLGPEWVDLDIDL